MTSLADSVAKAASEYSEPIRAAVHEHVRDARRAVAAGGHALEDCTDATALQIRRHPFASIGIAAGIGAVVGGVIGLTFRRAVRRPPGTP
jgi:ElaB/YqjD/DUF883 family membrane-anchored ribosome-binding protein